MSVQFLKDNRGETYNFLDLYRDKNDIRSLQDLIKILQVHPEVKIKSIKVVWDA